MSYPNEIFRLMIRGNDISDIEKGRIIALYEAEGKDNIYSAMKKKKILPFAARTLSACGLDKAFWQEILEEYRERNQAILACLDKAYTALKNEGVRKMFVSENFGALLSANEDIALFASGDVDNYADPNEKGKIYRAFEKIGFSRTERFSGKHQIAAEFYPPEGMGVPEGFYISVDFYPLARLKLPCFIEADNFVEWSKLHEYQNTSVVLPPMNAIMYICMLHISLHSFSRAPDIRLYIDLFNMCLLPVDYNLIAQWCKRDHTCTRAATAALLSNKLMKTDIPPSITELSARSNKILRVVFDTTGNDLIYEPNVIKVLLIEILCNDEGSINGLCDIFFPESDWMKKVYGSKGLVAHIKHFLKVL